MKYYAMSQAEGVWLAQPTLQPDMPWCTMSESTMVQIKVP